MKLADRVVRGASVVLCSIVHMGCTIGRGEGFVTSDDLSAGICQDGAFDLEPDFFAANPYENAQLIRLQNGDKEQETADGLLISVLDVATIRGDNGSESMLGVPILVGLPAGVQPLGVAPTYDNPLVSMTLYLNATCRDQDDSVSLQALSGTITFSSLFSGKINESRKSDRLIEASFDVIVGDPRDGSPEDEAENRVTGQFRFYFRRGQPAQPFP